MREKNNTTLKKLYSTWFYWKLNYGSMTYFTKPVDRLLKKKNITLWMKLGN